MKCKECGASLQGDHNDSLTLECKACGKFLFDCHCSSRLGYTPSRIVHCHACDREFITEVNTSKRGWRSKEV